MNDLASVIVPLYNYRRYIEDLICSLQRQDHENWELIIVDDHSTDNPLPVIEKYLDDPKIQYHLLPSNRGYATAKNEGLLFSKGKYVVVLDADDVLNRSSLSSRIKFLRTYKKYKWVHAKAYEFSNNIKNRWWRKRKFIRRFQTMRKTKNYSGVWNAIHAQTVMARRECYLKVGLYEETMRSMSDKEMWARFAYNIGIPGYLDRFVVYYRMHSGQMHRSKFKRRNADRLSRKMNKLIKARKSGKFVGVRKLEK